MADTVEPEGTNEATAPETAVTEPVAQVPEPASAVTEPAADAGEAAEAAEAVTEPAEPSEPSEPSEATEGEPDAEQAQVVQRGWRPTLTAGLAAALAVVVVFGGVMTAFAVQQRSLANERNRTIAAQEQQAEVAKAYAAQQDAKIKEIEAKLLDPKGYELIKECVRNAARGEEAQERLAKAFEEAARTGRSAASFLTTVPGDQFIVTVDPATGVAGVPTVCREGEKALK